MIESELASAKETSASELLGESPVKKSRPAWPADSPFVETFPGSKTARHPVDKAFCSMAKARELGCVIFPAQPTAKPQPTATGEPTAPPPSTPQQPTQPTPAATSTAEAQPENKTEEAAPDFSELSGEQKTDDQPKQPTPEERKKSHFLLAAIIWDSIINMLSAFTGVYWQPVNPAERDSVVNAIVDWMEWVGVKVLNPFQRMCAAIGMYCFGRLPALWQWFKFKRAKKVNATPEKTESREPEAKAATGVNGIPASDFAPPTDTKKKTENEQ